MKKLTIGIPAFKADKHISDCLSSIQIQTSRNDVTVVISADNPEDDYSFVKDRFPDLDITILPCDQNGGPGIARQRCLEACKTEWITWIDADDVFYTPFAIEQLMHGVMKDVIEVQGTFFQEVKEKSQSIRAIPQQNPFHPWVFGRMYNAEFLRQNEIGFSELRAMEDGELNYKIRMTIEGTPWKINIINDPVYLWRIGSEHSITRIGVEKDGIPQYNFDLCQLGATIACINAAKFCKKKNPFNGSIDRFITEMMVDKYFTYVECVAKKKVFADQNLFNAKRFYHECYKDIEGHISEKILKDIYTMQRQQHGRDLLGIIPEISFFEFMDRIKTEEYGGKEELEAIRARLPRKIIKNDLKTGVAVF